MVEPFTMTAVGALALTEGIKFLYGQAGEVLKRWRERKAAGSEPAAEEAAKVVLPSEAFDGQLQAPRLHFEAVERLERDLRDLRGAVAEYAQGIDEVDPGNRQLLETVDALRRALEAVYGQRITFKGEPRPASGPLVSGKIDVGEVAGYAAAVRARVISSGQVTGEAKANRVEPGGQLLGVDADTIGDQGG